ncbi:MAG: DEAD/DEAH box helicase [Bacteroidales bacterium]|nr:DEAD/DEAH box helicase [Bacteroidales bacterium]
MEYSTTITPGKLVRYRDRRWVVLPSDDEDIILLKPLGGSEHEITGVYRPLSLPGEEITEDYFPLPTENDLGSFETARLLFNASRLTFRNASGPFRCIGKLSFRPRSYQIVPLVMALQQKISRLLIADDVGIGKTVEALIILKELIERGEVKRFAIICPPHLCEQWHVELKDKLDIQSEIIRSSTAAYLDRRLPDDRSIFYHVPYQVISIDYIKSDKKKDIFLNDCPELVIVDEVHTCALPEGAKSRTQQQRHKLIYDLSKNKSRHLILLTATPHSGKNSEFQSLLELLNSEFGSFDFENINQEQRKKIADFFIQRKRENIKHWLNEKTPFPERKTAELAYHLSRAYLDFYNEVLNFARGISKGDDLRTTRRVRWWAALALLRGVMSSPAAGLEMLKNRKTRKLEEEPLTETEEIENPALDGYFQDSDNTQTYLLDNADLNRDELKKLDKLSEKITQLANLQNDLKAVKAIDTVKNWIERRFHPIVFCRFIETANYFGKLLKEDLPENITVEIITSEYDDEQRREMVEQLGKSEKRVLIATDCLSEGINLQNYFTVVLHYDLPWNPNRIEQRDGRVDRFGQPEEKVESLLLYGENNPVDRIVLDVLIKKIRDIQRSTGVNISVNENNISLFDELYRKLLIESEKQEEGKQLRIFVEETQQNELENIKKQAEKIRSIFAHTSVKPELIEPNLKEVDEAIGDVKTVENFVAQSLRHLKVNIEKKDKGYVMFTRNLPKHLKDHFGDREKVLVSFESPTPAGYRYLGRNHLFVDQLCQLMLSLAIEGGNGYDRVARVAEIQTDAVKIKTTLVMFRVRNVIRESQSRHEVISEEMYLWGYRGSVNSMETIDYAEGKQLLNSAISLINLSPERQKTDIKNELERFENLKNEFIKVANLRAENLVNAHGRFRNLVGGRKYEKVQPVLPPDVMGVYILIPKPAF